MTRRLQSLAIAAAIVLADHLSKLYIRSHIAPWEVIPVIPGFFNIIHTENPGAAFGFLSESNSPWSGLLLIGVSVAVAAILGYLLFRASPAGAKDSALMRVGFALVFGGAIGNLWDRLFRGTVTDFLQFFFGAYEFPSFNVADSAITIGAALLLIDLWLSHAKESHAASRSGS